MTVAGRGLARYAGALFRGAVQRPGPSAISR
jgi:hypothetical protein